MEKLCPILQAFRKQSVFGTWFPKYFAHLWLVPTSSRYVQAIRQEAVDTARSLSISWGQTNVIEDLFKVLTYRHDRGSTSKVRAPLSQYLVAADSGVLAMRQRLEVHRFIGLCPNGFFQHN